MKTINLKLTLDELKLLTSLATDQLFRREFIDPKMPGYRSNAVELGVAKSLVSRLRLMTSPHPPGSTILPNVKATNGVTL